MAMSGYSANYLTLDPPVFCLKYGRKGASQSSDICGSIKMQIFLPSRSYSLVCLSFVYPAVLNIPAECGRRVMFSL